MKYAKTQHQLNAGNLGGGGGGAGGASSGLEGREDWWNQQRPDGRYMYAENRRQLCCAWNRSADGCTDPLCSSNPQRAHGCEWCREPHRVNKSPSHPLWVPPPPTSGGDRNGKGNGKGKARF